ncbi:chemotaxis protein CheW [Leeia sp. TBRC 13508]|uniref:Chemotaxis protein CheW n=1 Tax=Leeia speluncae TaxID=2884804 RepID=A0ABS8D3K0_9NEIS|nr:chemotaxis protein CheW [Leeia speluncae]MCB6182747.1 chemotaxis protein CheW [Leeia speluncae]
MAKRVSLREFQERVSQRLQSATSGQVKLSSLGVKVGGHHFLIDLTQVSEVISVPPVLPVTMTHDWYKGVTNIRGTLYSVSDLSLFLLGEPAMIRPGNRLLLLQHKLLDNSALLVEQIVGLRQLDLLNQDIASLTGLVGECVGQSFTDETGAIWHQLDLEKLVKQPSFLQVNREQ